MEKLLIRLSQGQLNMLEACPRKFQHLYLDQLAIPVALEQQEQMNWGSRFHLLMQQREMGIAAGASNRQDLESHEIEQHVAAFVQAAPELFTAAADQFRGSEYRRSLEVEGYLLTVIYDLVIASDTQAQILDWKTYPRPRQAEGVRQNWQTRLYPFVLAETSDFAPEQIAMTYWFVRGKAGQPPEPQYLHFPYNAELHQQIKADLIRVLGLLSQWLAQYEAAGQALPQVDAAQGRCQDCAFAVRCQRDQSAQALRSQQFPDIAAIEEISLLPD